MQAREFLKRIAEGQREFVDVNLSRADLDNAFLDGANLSGATFFEASLHRANLTGATLDGANLSGANLSGAQLNNADLRRADLSGANLVSVNLSSTNLRDADLTGANLAGANLRGANLSSGASLSGANLRGADLTGANLIRVDLSGANLTGVDLTSVRLSAANVASTIFSDIDLSPVAAELLTVRHLGPSVVATSTLTRSCGRIPKEFLKGCGLADWEIEHARLYDPDLSAFQVAEIVTRVHELRAKGPIQFYSVFISHSHADKAFARRLYKALDKHGVRCWFDEKQMLPGDDIHDRIDHGIRVWDKVLLCASKESLTSWWVDAEIERAFAKEQRLMKERGEKVLVLIPLALDAYLFTEWSSGKATQVQTRIAGDFKAWKSESFDFEKAVGSLVRALRADGGGRELPPLPRL